MRISLPHNWRPRHYQQEAWDYLKEGGKRAVLRWHRRSGKDDLFLHHTACSAHERVGNYWYMLPQYSQARKSMWDAINPHSGKRRLDEVFPAEVISAVKDQEMMIRLKSGSTFQLVGSDNYNSLVGSPPIGLVFSEYALSNPAAWAYLMPIIEENGGWVGFNSTPRGNNHFRNLCDLAAKEPGWFVQSRTADETDVYTPEQLQAILRQMQATHGEDYGKSLWLQEYYVSFDAAIPGSIFGEWLDKARLEGRIGSVPIQAEFPVHTAWDLGHTDATAIWFYQHVFGEIHILDYEEASLKDIPWYADLLRRKAKEGGYQYGTHWLPHDARARTLAAGGKSIQQQMLDQNVGRIVIAKRLDHVDGIQAARATLPHCHFDEEKSGKGLEALRNYHYEWDDEKKIFSSMPAHDWASHGSSAFRTLALSWRTPKAGEAPPQTVIERLMSRNPVAQTFGAMKKKHFARMQAMRTSR